MSARESWAQEMESVFLYRVFAESEPSPERRALFAKLAGEAEAQAAIWAAEIQKIARGTPDAFRAAGARAGSSRRWSAASGRARMRGVLAAMKVRGMSIYSSSAPAGAGARGRARDAASRSRRSAAATAARRAAATCARRCSAPATAWCRTPA